MLKQLLFCTLLAVALCQRKDNPDKKPEDYKKEDKKGDRKSWQDYFDNDEEDQDPLSMDILCEKHECPPANAMESEGEGFETRMTYA